MKRLLVAILVCMAIPVQAATLEWTAPTTTVDGQSITLRPVTSYQSHCAVTDPNLVPGVKLPADKTLWTTPAMPDGDYLCGIKAVNADGASEISNLLRVVCSAGVCIKPGAPAPPVVSDVVYIIVKNSTYPTRPLKDSPDGKQIGIVEILNADTTPRRCEQGAALKITSSGEWRWTTNAAGLRGVTLCKVLGP